MAAALAADTVAGLLRGAATRAATLDALERHESGGIDRAVSLAAAPPSSAPAGAPPPIASDAAWGAKSKSIPSMGGSSSSAVPADA